MFENYLVVSKITPQTLDNHLLFLLFEASLFVQRRDFEAAANNGAFQDELDLSSRVFIASLDDASVTTSRDAVTSSRDADSVTLPYKIVAHHFFPFRRDDRPVEEKVLKKFYHATKSSKVDSSS